MDFIWNGKVEAFWFQFFYCRLSLYLSVLASRCHISAMLDTVQDCKEMSVGGFSNWFAKEADCGRPGRNRAAGQSKQGL